MSQPEQPTPQDFPTMEPRPEPSRNFPFLPSPVELEAAAVRHAILENYREAMASVIDLLRPCKDSTASDATEEVINLLTCILGMDGRAHLEALRQHEALVMGLLAYRINALEALLPDTCPHCGLLNRTHEPRCRYGLALTLVPEGMPPIETSAVFRLGVVAEQVHRWAHELDQIPYGPGSIDKLRQITTAMREVSTNI